ncbi:TonB-dependent receptor [Sphingomonas sp. PAMC 26621]|uniref:TonB-dependent receptor n=1 Tax=Sphingomonas sp. PAMC 26621 TaxID=1112213 RepID=UPI001EE64134|nr:carboxypeptidase regulatory-like domain-containing protein [Sphingomonas sp. PAMC 26621]
MTCSTRFSRAVVVRALLLLGTSLPVATLSAAPASAQDYTNIAASGRVTSDAGAPIANAEVSITASDRGISRSATTNESGAYTIAQLAPGNYDFTVTAPGFAPYTEKAVALTRGTGGANSFKLAPAVAASAEASNDIVVTGRRQRVADFQDTTTGAVIDIASLQTRVPVGRTLRDVMLLTPGTVQGASGANGGFANQVSVSGASFTENAFYINGLNVTDFVSGQQPTEVPFDFYQTVEVKTGGAPAEFGRATGGYVVATTKSGSNTYTRASPAHGNRATCADPRHRPTTPTIATRPRAGRNWCSRQAGRSSRITCSSTVSTTSATSARRRLRPTRTMPPGSPTPARSGAASSTATSPARIISNSPISTRPTTRTRAAMITTAPPTRTARRPAAPMRAQAGSITSGAIPAR